MFIDTHAHVNFNAFKSDGDEVIVRALDNNIWMINVGSQYSSSKRAVEYAQKYSQGVYAAVGIHPLHLETVKVDLAEEEGFESREEEFEERKYKELAKDPKVVALGEIGLDYYHIDNKRHEFIMSDPSRSREEIEGRQKEVFVAQLKLAQEVAKPVIIHCREAHQDMLPILLNAKKEYQRLTGVMHCFAGDLEQAQEYISLGFLISFTGLITFSRNWDEVIQNIDLDNIMIETDCPYLTPVPFRGKRNEPMYVKYVAEKMAEIKKVPLEEVEKKTFENAKRLFHI